jgi:predicted nucleic acid-binding protein
VVEPALFDTVILIDFLKGIPQAREAVASYADRAISVITWMEVMAGATSEQESTTALFLSTFVNLPLTAAIAKQAVIVRRATKLKLPDAIILATAQVDKRLLLTRNTRDFRADRTSVHIPYQI